MKFSQEHNLSFPFPQETKKHPPSTDKNANKFRILSSCYNLRGHCEPVLTLAWGAMGARYSGGRSDQSEWQRSIKLRISVSPKILSGTATGTSPDKTRTYDNRLCWCLPAAVLSGFAQKVPKDATRGSEVAAACGRARQPNEWQRSVCNAGVSSPRRTQGTATGAALSLTAPAPKATLPGTPPGAHFRWCYTRFRCI